LKYFLLFRNFEQLALVLKTEFALIFFTVLKYFLSFRHFEQLALALKIFKPGTAAPLRHPPRSPMGVWYRG